MYIRQNFLKRTETLISSDEMNELLAISSDFESEISNEKTFNTHHFYMQFLKHSLANRHKENQKDLSLSELHLLEQIAVRYEMKKPISVSEISLMKQFGCSSTIHHLINKLKQLGMILVGCSDDGLRKKIITLSPVGVAYFQDVEDRIDMALQG